MKIKKRVLCGVHGGAFFVYLSFLHLAFSPLFQKISFRSTYQPLPCNDFFANEKQGSVAEIINPPRVFRLIVIDNGQSKKEYFVTDWESNTDGLDIRKTKYGIAIHGIDLHVPTHRRYCQRPP